MCDKPEAAAGMSSPRLHGSARISDAWCHKLAMKHAMKLAPDEMTMKDLRYLATRIAHLYQAVKNNHLPNDPRKQNASLEPLARKDHQ